MKNLSFFFVFLVACSSQKPINSSSNFHKPQQEKKALVKSYDQDCLKICLRNKTKYSIDEGLCSICIEYEEGE